MPPDIEAARQIGIGAAQAYVDRHPFDVADSLGVRVNRVDHDHLVAGLRLRAEYDYDARKIVLYRHGIAELGEHGEAIAVAHELFHHLAATDDTIASKLRAFSRSTRAGVEEAAAHAFATEWLRLTIDPATPNIS